MVRQHVQKEFSLHKNVHFRLHVLISNIKKIINSMALRKMKVINCFYSVRSDGKKYYKTDNLVFTLRKCHDVADGISVLRIWSILTKKCLIDRSSWHLWNCMPKMLRSIERLFVSKNFLSTQIVGFAVGNHGNKLFSHFYFPKWFVVIRLGKTKTSASSQNFVFLISQFMYNVLDKILCWISNYEAI